MNQVKNYLSLIKFSHTIFALPFAVVGFLLALYNTGISFDSKLFFLMVLCMVFARSAAMAFNRYADREFDKANPRTFVREIPSGIITPSEAITFVIGNCVLFVATTYFINPICFYLSPVALIIVLGYSITKRFTALCHLVLGLGLSLAPIGAYLVVAGKFAMLPILFSLVVLFWVSGFDIIYALQDVEFDSEKKLKSIPVYLGKQSALNLSRFLHFLSFSILLFAGYYAQFGAWYWAGWLAFSCLLVYQHTLVSANDLSRVNLAFFTTNGFASLLFSIFFIFEMYL